MMKDTKIFLNHIHEYFGIDLDLTFEIVKKDLPELKEKISKILEGIQ